MTIEFDNVQQVHTSCTFKSKRVRDTWPLTYWPSPSVQFHTLVGESSLILVLF